MIIDVPTKIKIKYIISEKKYEDLYPVGSSPAILYDGVSPLWPVFSAISTPIYKPSKFLTLNEYTIKDSFSFAEEFRIISLIW